MNKFLLLLVLFQFQLFCSAQDDYLVIGSGGGFSGEIIKYKVLRDGTVLKANGIADVKYVNQGHIRKCDAKKLFNKIDKIVRQSFSHPGNMYYFIYHIKPNSELKCTWGDTKFELPEDLNKLYGEILQKLSKLEYKPINK